ncbi:MAG: hypothetical protein SPI09_08060 [Candidatus Limivicinus sp.]|nr:hypothetical protein [Clostridiales bacterium]MCI7137482.1 hypothetical protein [Clostridiales bacterium]MDY6133297.1 hypothetical protein [Candidatus Limivicinus sp.]
MKRFLGVWVIWFVLLLIGFMLFGNYLLNNFYAILLAVSLLLAIFTCVLVSQSDAIEALEKRIDALEDKSSSDSIEKE